MILYGKKRLTKSDKDTIMTEILENNHDFKVTGNFGKEKTIELVQRNFYRHA